MNLADRAITDQPTLKNNLHELRISWFEADCHCNYVARAKKITIDEPINIKVISDNSQVEKDIDGWSYVKIKLSISVTGTHYRVMG